MQIIQDDMAHAKTKTRHAPPNASASAATAHPTAVIARLTPATYRRLRLSAAQRNESMSAFVRRAIVDALGDAAP